MKRLMLIVCSMAFAVKSSLVKINAPSMGEDTDVWTLAEYLK